MEKLLEKLGAQEKGSGWELKRLVDCMIWPQDMSADQQWLLIGEITEALREKGWDEFRATYYTLGNAALIIRSHENRMQEPVFECDEGILACYIKAGEELL